MKVLDKNIGGHLVSVKSWGFFKLLENKKKLIDIIGKSSNEIIDFFNMDDSGDGIDEIINFIKGSISSFDLNDIQWFAKTILQNVKVDGKEMINEDDVDDILSGNTTLFYEIVMLVMEANYGDFFEMIRSKLIKTEEKTLLETSLES